MEGEACVQRGRLVYKGARLFNRGGDSSTEAETRLQGGDSSTKGEARLGTILDAIGNVQNGPNTVLYVQNIYIHAGWQR
jgi:hypothetical protein